MFSKDDRFCTLSIHPIQLDMIVKGGESRGVTYSVRRESGVDQTPEQ